MPHEEDAGDNDILRRFFFILFYFFLLSAKYWIGQWGNGTGKTVDSGGIEPEENQMYEVPVWTA